MRSLIGRLSKTSISGKGQALSLAEQCPRNNTILAMLKSFNRYIRIRKESRKLETIILSSNLILEQ